MGKIYQANINHKEAGVALLITEKLHFRTKNIAIDKEDIWILNMYASNNSFKIKQKLIKIREKNR